MNTAPGWYPDDPARPEHMRWWDGQRWTEHTNESDPQPTPAPGPQRPQQRPTHEQPDAASVAAVLHEPPGGGLLGGKKALQQENAELRAALESMGIVQREQLRVDVCELERQRTELAAELEILRRQVLTTKEEAVLQEVGIYEYSHPLDSAVAYQQEKDRIVEQIKAMAKTKSAITSATDWTVNGSVAQGRKMVNDFSKLMLRAYNNEADNAVRAMRPYRLESAIKRLDTARGTISRLGATMSISITAEYHRLRQLELQLTADYLAKLAEEKEAEREERERLREEAKAQREFERERDRLRKEQAHYQTVVTQLRAAGKDTEAAAAEQKLAEIGGAIEGVEERAANIRAGYVYVISNIGAFGERMVKIGMTRRLDPMDRVRELGDASVPFRYDVHAIIFCEDAVALEAALHRALTDRRVNMVNARREFFYATPAEVKALLTQIVQDASLLQYEETPVADEWHQSENQRRVLSGATSLPKQSDGSVERTQQWAPPAGSPAI